MRTRVTSDTLRVLDIGELREESRAEAKAEKAGSYNLRILQPAFAYVRDVHGQDMLDSLIHDCGLPKESLHQKSTWITHEMLERAMASLRELAGSEEAFMEVCVYQTREQYGPVILLLRSMSVRRIYELMSRTFPTVCRDSQMEVANRGRGTVTLRYRTSLPESRLICLSRQASLSNVPTIFSASSPAKLNETACIAHGDDHCEYALRWYEPLSLRLVLVGMVVGAITAALVPPLWGIVWLSYVVFIILGGTVGRLIELQRVLTEQLRFSEETAKEMQGLSHAYTDALDELGGLQMRERSWSRRVEEGIAERTKKLNLVVRRLNAALERRMGARASTSDPLTALPDLAERFDTQPGTGGVRAVENAVDRVSHLLGELADIAHYDPTRQQTETEAIDVDKLVDNIRRQLRATMMNRGVRVTVFQNREAPVTVYAVRPIIERVIDNMLFNASRHTDHGSVVVEVSGMPGHLLLKVSDTGQGVSKERLEQLFDTGEGSRTVVENNSGLSSAARLLDHLGGRLEVMSEPSAGTTLWATIPIGSPPSSASGSHRAAVVVAEQDELKTGSDDSRVLSMPSTSAPDTKTST